MFNLPDCQLYKRAAGTFLLLVARERVARTTQPSSIQKVVNRGDNTRIVEGRCINLAINLQGEHENLKNPISSSFDFEQFGTSPVSIYNL